MKNNWMLYPYWTWVDMIGALLLCLLGFGLWWWVCPIGELEAFVVTTTGVGIMAVLNVRSNLKFARENPPCAECEDIRTQLKTRVTDVEYSAWVDRMQNHVRTAHPERLRYEARNG